VVSAEVSVEEVKHSWEAIKAGERAGRQLHGILADVPHALPALPRAQKLQKRAAQSGFDWPGVDGVLDKLREEIAELQAAREGGDKGEQEAELGDILFTCVNLARHLGCDAETALRRSAQKFEQRFSRMEVLAAELGSSVQALGADPLDLLWRQAKDDTAAGD
jgi:ATP diphosphatase